MSMFGETRVEFTISSSEYCSPKWHSVYSTLVVARTSTPEDPAPTVKRHHHQFTEKDLVVGEKDMVRAQIRKTMIAEIDAVLDRVEAGGRDADDQK